MAKRKPVPPEKQKYTPVFVALRTGLLGYLKNMAENMSKEQPKKLQRTKLIDMIVAGIIREGVEFNKVFKNLDDEQKKLLEELRSGGLASPYISLHRSTAPEFYKLMREKGWTKSMLLERMLTSYILTPEAERVELLEPPKEVKTVDAKEFADLIILPESPDEDELDPDPADCIPFDQDDLLEEDRRLSGTAPKMFKFLLILEKSFSRYLLDYAKNRDTTRTRLVEKMISDACAGGVIFSGDISVLNQRQRELYDKLFTNKTTEYNYIMIKKSVVDEFEKCRELTAWDRTLLMKRMLLTWVLAPWPPVKKE